MLSGGTKAAICSGFCRIFALIWVDRVRVYLVKTIGNVIYRLFCRLKTQYLYCTIIQHIFNYLFILSSERTYSIGATSVTWFPRKPPWREIRHFELSKPWEWFCHGYRWLSRHPLCARAYLSTDSLAARHVLGRQLRCGCGDARSGSGRDTARTGRALVRPQRYGRVGFLQPPADDRSIQSARISQHDLVDLHASSVSSCVGNAGWPEVP